jgi:Ni/Fe-hydrogenase b-type cytochrome subunit
MMSGKAVTPSKAVLRTRSARFEPPEIAYALRAGGERKATYEHSFAIRFTHWLNAIALFVMAGSGLRIYLAFPAFGDKLPPHDFFVFPGRYTIGGWLGGALQWHFTFMWLFMASGLVYVFYQLITGTWRQVIFAPRDVRRVWPMFRHYFLFGPKPEQSESYNSLQKLAYTSTILLGVLSTITGLILYKSAQLSFLIPLFGGYRSVRILHFLSLLGFLAFVAGHIVMVIAHGWNNFQSMLTGWNFKPEYTKIQSTETEAEDE